MSPNISDWILASIQMEDPSLYQELCQLLSERKKKIEQGDNNEEKPCDDI